MVWWMLLMSSSHMWLRCEASVRLYNEKGVNPNITPIQLRSLKTSTSCAPWTYSLGSHTVACETNPTCGLDTKFIIMDFLNTDVFYVQLSFKRTDCLDPNDRKTLSGNVVSTTCKKTINMIIYLIKEDRITPKLYSIPQNTPYNTTETITDVLMVDLPVSLVNLRISLHVTADDFCGEISNVSVYSYQCDEQTTSLATYSQIQAGMLLHIKTRI